MENHSLTINISKNNAKACFRSRASARTDVLKLSLIIMRCHIELKAIRNPRQLGIYIVTKITKAIGNSGKLWQSAIVGNGELLGNAGNRGELAIGKRWE